MENKKEMTIPNVSAATDAEQSLSKCTDNSIVNQDTDFKGYEQSFEEMQREILRQLDPSYLKTVSMTTLYDTVFEVQTPLIDGLLQRGTYLFVGSPKVGKSFMMAQLAYHISTGTPLWEYKVRKATVLYFALEDDYPRLQKRLFQMFGAKETGNLYFATECKTVNGGLEEQIRGFMREHPDTGLIIIDTLKRVREAGGADYSYASDYDVVARLKALADSYKVSMLIVHHTRKQKSEDIFDMISGTNGLMGAADGAFVLSKDKRTSNNATLDVAGRDQQDMKIHLVRDSERLVWNFAKSETEMWKEPPEPLLEKIADTLFSESDRWEGTASELCERLAVDIKPNVLSLRLSINASAIFNHAVNFYHLPSNPAQKAGNMGKEEHREMLFWTKEEYLKFADVMMDEPVSYYAFEILYWCGLRMGELLALTPADFNFETQTLRINKSYQRLHREDVITPPKTLKSNRTIKMPQFLCDEMQDYLKMLYEPKEDERIFTISKSYLHHEMNRGSKISGVKRIRVHDLRHSHVSLLINMGFTVLAIADRMGHESIDITYRYAHLFPSEQTQMAEQLDIERMEKSNGEESGQ